MIFFLQPSFIHGRQIMRKQISGTSGMQSDKNFKWKGIFYKRVELFFEITSCVEDIYTLSPLFYRGRFEKYLRIKNIYVENHFKGQN